MRRVTSRLPLLLPLVVVLVLVLGIVMAFVFNSQTHTTQPEKTSSIIEPTSTVSSSPGIVDMSTSIPSVPVTTGSIYRANVSEPTTTIITTTTIAAITTTTATATTTPSQDNSLPPEIAINPQTIVGVLCYYNTTLTNPLNRVTVDGGQFEQRGSGVIIDKRGYILTNRHVVATPQESSETITISGITINVVRDYQLDHCESGQVPAGATLPTLDEIRTYNPAIRVPVLAYTVKAIYTPSTAGMSNNEANMADFALLKITGLTEVASTFGIVSLPGSFPTASLLGARAYIKPGDQVVTYGFPGDITLAQHNFFQTLDMTGSIGNITRVEFGDTYYADSLLTLYTKMEVSHGRSGSPLFWRGYVIGLTTFFIGDNRTDSGSVASDAILKSLRSAGYAP